MISSKAWPLSYGASFLRCLVVVATVAVMKETGPPSSEEQSVVWRGMPSKS